MPRCVCVCAWSESTIWCWRQVTVTSLESVALIMIMMMPGRTRSSRRSTCLNLGTRNQLRARVGGACSLEQANSQSPKRPCTPSNKCHDRYHSFYCTFILLVLWILKNILHIIRYYTIKNISHIICYTISEDVLASKKPPGGLEDACLRSPKWGVEPPGGFPGRWGNQI